jgi:hypothetical protein
MTSGQTTALCLAGACVRSRPAMAMTVQVRDRKVLISRRRAIPYDVPAGARRDGVAEP